MTTETIYLTIIAVLVALIFHEVIIALILIIACIPFLIIYKLFKSNPKTNFNNKSKNNENQGEGNTFTFQDENGSSTIIQNGNGNNFQSKGNNISIINGRVFIDGKEIKK